MANRLRHGQRTHDNTPRQQLSVRMVLALIVLVVFALVLYSRLTNQEQQHLSPWEVLRLLHGSRLRQPLINTDAVDFSPRYIYISHGVRHRKRNEYAISKWPS